MPLPLRRRTLAAAATIAGGLVLGFPSAAGAHSLDSSTLAVRVQESLVQVTVSVPLETLDDVLGTDYATAADIDDYADAVIAYLDEHLTVTGTDGTRWAEAYSGPVREAVEGIESFSVEVDVDPEGADPSNFTISYDAIIEADPTHEAVVVLTDTAGEISTPGVLDAARSTLAIGDATEAGLADMVRYGYHHVLDGADHLAFLLTLLLVAPLVATDARWRRRDAALSTVRSVLGVVTAFTVGHSLTLIAAALGWLWLPGVPVEVLIAASVAVAAVHALRPLARRGEVISPVPSAWSTAWRSPASSPTWDWTTRPRCRHSWPSTSASSWPSSSPSRWSSPRSTWLHGPAPSTRSGWSARSPPSRPPQAGHSTASASWRTHWPASRTPSSATPCTWSSASRRSPDAACWPTGIDRGRRPRPEAFGRVSPHRLRTARAWLARMASSASSG